MVIFRTQVIHVKAQSRLDGFIAGVIKFCAVTRDLRHGRKDNTFRWQKFLEQLLKITPTGTPKYTKKTSK